MMVSSLFMVISTITVNTSLISVLLNLPPSEGFAQTPQDTREIHGESPLNHWAYSLWLGPGTYAVNQSEQFHVALPARLSLSKDPDASPRYVLIGGATVGIESFGWPGSGLDIGALRFNAGLRATWRVAERWRVGPLIEGGLGLSWVGGPNIYVIGGGAQSVYTFKPLGRYRLKWAQRILIATHHDRAWSGDAFVQLKSTLDLTTPYDFSLFSKRLNLNLFSAYSLSTDRLSDRLSTSSSYDELTQLVQLGIHIGAPRSLLRVGIRYVMGASRFQGIRLSLGPPI